MAQRRMLSKSIGQSRKLAKISLKSALLYTWMIPFLDDYGRYEAMTDTVKSEVVRYRKDFSERTIASCLKELADIVLIVLYQVEGYTYFEQVNFEKHQTLRTDRQRQAVYPIPPWGPGCWQPEGNQRVTEGILVTQQDEDEVEVEDEVEGEGESAVLKIIYDHWSQSIHPVTSSEGWDLRKLFIDLTELHATLATKFPKEEFNSPEDNIHEEVDTLVSDYPPDKRTVRYLRGMLSGKAKEAYGVGLR